MAQVPATPKGHRALLRVAAALSTGLAERVSLQASEAEAIAARKRPLDLAEAPSPEVVFLVPLVGRHHVGDWSAVSDRLARTLQSFLRQTDPHWRALICGQDRPDGLPDDSRLIWLPFTQAVQGNDKWDKLAALAGALPCLGVRQGWAMPFDADDLLASHSVAEMRTRRRPGYVVTQGLMHDAATGGWARTRPQSLRHPGQKSFWKLCGSCAACGFPGSAGPADAAWIGAATAHEHRMFPYLARLARRPLTPLSADAALYIVNHGENFGVRRGRVGFKTRFVARYRLTDPGEVAEARSAFPLG
ncbi:MAG: hypothetical protein AAFR47_14990 [Pseudomonadota bacterium]